MIIRRASLLVLALFSVVCSAEIQYTVTPLPTANRIKVAMSFSALAGGLEVLMPNWSPGAYFFSEHGRNVADFAAHDGAGAQLRFAHVRSNTWTTTLVKGGVVNIEYTVPVPFAEGAMHYSGPSSYMYIVGRKTEPCVLTLDSPKSWKIAVGLDAVGDSYWKYSASDYDTLADNPVTMGDFIELRYESHGKPMTIAMRGALRGSVDRDKVIKVCKAISDGEGDFFGGLPFSKYVWHFAITPGADGGGGLEHLSSTQISLAQGVGPRSVRVCAHEFFHLWNVKRIRSKVLGPFDYTKLPRTGALYWLEGVTDYYASLLCLRYGALDELAFLNDLVENTTAVRNNEARLRVSPYESSLRVGETNGGRGNSNGYEISYYNLGWLVGLCLDIEIRSETGGKRSLDDVEHMLWTQCKDGQPGFAEGEIRKHVVMVGGAKLGAFFDRVVMKPGELPLEEQLAKIGYKLSHDDVSYVDPGFDVSPAFGGGGLNVVRTRGTSPLRANDQVLEIGGKAIVGETRQELVAAANAALSAMKVGTPVSVKIMRDGKTFSVSVSARNAVRTTWNVTDVANGDQAKLALREQLFFAGKK